MPKRHNHGRESLNSIRCDDCDPAEFCARIASACDAVDQASASRQTRTHSRVRTGFAGGFFVPFVSAIAFIGITVAATSSLGWRAANSDLRAQVEKTNRIAGEMEAAAMVSEAAMDQLRGIISSYIGSAEANIATGDLAEAVQLIRAIQELREQGVSLNEVLNERHGRTRDDFAVEILLLLNFDSTNEETLQDIVNRVLQETE